MSASRTTLSWERPLGCSVETEIRAGMEIAAAVLGCRVNRHGTERRSRGGAAPCIQHPSGFEGGYFDDLDADRLAIGRLIVDGVADLLVQNGCAEG